MKKSFIKMIICIVVIFATSACELEPVPDPNFAAVEDVSNNASKSALNSLIVGQVAVARNGLATYLQVTGTIGKELFNFNSTESRWMVDLNGLRALSNSVFYNTATTAFGLPVRQANIILSAVDNTSSVSELEKQSYRGVANTFKGLASLYMLNVQFTNGIRLNVEDPFNPSKPVSYEESLAGIAEFLDAGADQLEAAGDVFPFDLPSGYAEFNTPATFKKFNRAIALRVAIYQKDWAKAATLLPQTFIDESGSAGYLNIGPQHTFNASSPDIANPLLNVATSNIVGVQKIWDDAEPGDLRKNKVLDLTTEGDPLTYTIGKETYTSKYLSALYTRADQPFTIIRNEELLLIAAEIAAQQSNATEAVRYIDLIRNAAGLSSYTGGTTKDQLIDAILKERLYSLWYEGHRWIDMRRYDKLALIELPIPGMVVLDKLQRPAAEVNWDIANP